jgi:hypothetical protein
MACENPSALGWPAVPIFLTINILGAYVMPTVLIGIVVVSFDAATKHGVVEVAMVEKMHVAVHTAKENMPDFFTQWRIDRMLEAFQEIDADGELSLDMDEMTPFFAYVCYSVFDVNLTNVQQEMLYQIMDVDADADLGFAEFVMFLAVRRARAAIWMRWRAFAHSGVGLCRLGSEFFNSFFFKLCARATLEPPASLQNSLHTTTLGIFAGDGVGLLSVVFFQVVKQIEKKCADEPAWGAAAFPKHADCRAGSPSTAGEAGGVTGAGLLQLASAQTEADAGVHPTLSLRDMHQLRKPPRGSSSGKASGDGVGSKHAQAVDHGNGGGDRYSAALEPGECLADRVRSLGEVVDLSVDLARIEERLRCAVLPPVPSKRINGCSPVASFAFVFIYYRANQLS